jgi:arylsulfatase A-like enzyme
VNGKNILLILTDQQRADTLSCYDPDGLCRTPHLDRFAEDAIVFDNGYTNCAVCSPARASLMTGLQPSHHGIQTNTRGYGCRVHDLPDTPELLSRRLASAGYRCGYTGKWHLGFDRTEPGSDTAPFPAWYFTEGNALPTTRGFIGDDFPGHGGGGYEYPLFQEYLRSNGLEFVVEHEYQEHTHPNHTCWGEVTSPVESTNEFFLVDRTIHYLERLRSVDQPFYFQLNFWGPHAPFYAPTRHLDPYRDMAIPPWPNFADPLPASPESTTSGAVSTSRGSSSRPRSSTTTGSCPASTNR